MSRPPHVPIDVLNAALDHLGSSVRGAFERLGICAEECERVGIYRSMHSEMFMMLCPVESMSRAQPSVYRSHARELIERYVSGEPLDLGTKAEVLLGMVDTSLVAPLNPGGTALYHHLFRDVMGEDAYRELFGDTQPPRERWPGETAELLDEARRQVRSGRPRRISVETTRGGDEHT